LNKLKNNYTVLGIMSGTSLDGIDLCIADFQINKHWNYKILNTTTIPYSSIWTEKLTTAENISGRALSKLDVQYGQLLGKEARKFIKSSKKKIDLISSHGHTVFHEPHHNYSKQIGHGAYIAAESGITTVSDIRSSDMAYGGQGAPVVPFGDINLFPEYEAWLNVGGIANICIKKDNDVIAFDIAAANMILNHICKKYLNTDYDHHGENAFKGKVNTMLLHRLNKFEYYSKLAPKSLGKEDIDKHIIPIIQQAGLSAEDLLSTYNQHLYEKIIQVTELYQITNNNILISGGGAYNKYLIELLRKRLQIKLPDKTTIEFKEALIFAFLGLNRFMGNINIINSVTGASHPTIAGAIFEPSNY